MIKNDPYVKGLMLLSDGLPIPFLYNPTEIEETRSVEYAVKKPLGMSHPKYHYQHGNDSVINWTMIARNKITYAGVTMPFPLEIYLGMLNDLTYPIYNNGVLISGPPTILFVFQAYVKLLKIKEIKIIRKQWDQYLTLKKAEIGISAIEIVKDTKQRFNSYKSLKEMPKNLIKYGGFIGH